jgi:hypothetical protein
VRQKTFTYTGGQQTWTVPAGVTEVAIEAWGAQGGPAACCNAGDETEDGGLGGYAVGTLKVTPGETLYVYVGGKGVKQGSGGFNGGGPGSTWGAGGGGASDVRQGGTAVGNRVIIGGGGGGGNCGCPDHGTGGDGGGKNGSDGLNLNGGFTPGGGGSQNGGGTAGSNPGTAGSLGQGGGVSQYHVAGGGGGYYGGGGAYAAGGGGGSSYIDNLKNASTSSGKQSGNGVVTIGW